jgi:imidazole glycerol phosphate synthase subunit HisF
MLKIRVIPRFDLKDARVVRGLTIVNQRDASDLVEQAGLYDAAGANAWPAS